MSHSEAPRKPLPVLDPDLDLDGLHYWSYHGLPSLLACKQPITASQDEDLFITVHQICELAMHQMIIDMDRALDALREALADDDPVGDTEECVYFLRRVNRLWRTLNTTMPILSDMRGFVEFRDAIGVTSGFQSFQFRHVEIMSGVPHYWAGGTADADGQLHVAESEFERHYGDDVQRWLADHAEHSLRHYFLQLSGRGDLARLREEARVRRLLAEFAAYDREQRRFHRAHLQLASVQLARVGVDTGTGGTSFKDYLARYDAEIDPLFPGLDGAGADG